MSSRPWGRRQVTRGDITICRLSKTLFLGNAARLFEETMEHVNSRPESHVVIVNMEETPHLASTTLDLRAEFDAVMKPQNIDLQLARAHEHVRAFLQAGGLDDLRSQCSYSVDDAVSAALTDVIPEETGMFWHLMDKRNWFHP